MTHEWREPPSPLERPMITIGERRIGSDHPVYVVAELSANHGQDIRRAKDLVRAAADVGADAVKLQTYTPATLTIDCDADPFRVGEGMLWQGRTLFDLYSEAYTPWEWHAELKELAEGLGLALFSSPFDPSAVDLLCELKVPAFKVASFEIVDLPLVQQIARAGKPMIISTGMATIAEIDRAVTAAREAGASEIALLRCTSAYPASPEDMDLRTIPHMADAWHVPVGLSDHTLGTTAAVAAVSLGASLLEKHFTLDRAEGGPDAEFSLTPQEFQRLVDAVREAERALGSVRYGPSSSETRSLPFRRSLFVVEDVREGEPFTDGNIRSIRPSNGLLPEYADQVLGRRATRSVSRGTPLTWDLVGGPVVEPLH